MLIGKISAGTFWCGAENRKGWFEYGYRIDSGEAFVLAARHRPKYVGGERAVYDPELA